MPNGIRANMQTPCVGRVYFRVRYTSPHVTSSDVTWRHVLLYMVSSSVTSYHVISHCVTIYMISCVNGAWLWKCKQKAQENATRAVDESFETKARRIGRPLKKRAPDCWKPQTCQEEKQQIVFHCTCCKSWTRATTSPDKTAGWKINGVIQLKQHVMSNDVEGVLWKIIYQREWIQAAERHDPY